MHPFNKNTGKRTHAQASADVMPTQAEGDAEMRDMEKKKKAAR
jgi:hypothetical protein